MHNDGLHKVADNPHLRRDPITKAIIDVDADAYARYCQQRTERQFARNKISQLEDRINKFETDISSIKTLLQQLLDK